MIENIEKIDGDEYTSDTKYWPKPTLDYYKWIYFEEQCVHL